jgi:hypothetical protein
MAAAPALRCAQPLPDGVQLRCDARCVRNITKHCDTAQGATFPGSGGRGNTIPMRVLLTGWPSFLRGEATAGDVLSMDRVHGALQHAGLPVEVAWSPVL